MPSGFRWEMVIWTILDKHSIDVFWNLSNNICQVIGLLLGNWREVTFGSWVLRRVCPNLVVNESLNWLK